MMIRSGDASTATAHRFRLPEGAGAIAKAGSVYEATRRHRSREMALVLS